MTPLSVTKAGWSAYKTAKEGVSAVVHPLQWLKSKLLGMLGSALLAAFKATLGPALAQAALDRLSVVGKSFVLTFEVPVPSSAVRHVQNPDALPLLQEVANEALAAPLELLGYRAGQVDVEYLGDVKKLKIRLKLGVLAPSKTNPLLVNSLSSVTATPRPTRP